VLDRVAVVLKPERCINMRLFETLIGCVTCGVRLRLMADSCMDFFFSRMPQ
jgi:hypothetical protein